MNTLTYKELKRDPTPSIECRIYSKLSELRKADIMSQTLHDYLATVCPNFYNLPEIHKSNVSVRPIVTSQGSPVYVLAKYLAEILKPVVGKSEHHVEHKLG